MPIVFYGVFVIFAFLLIVVLVKSMQIILISAACTFLVLFLLGLYQANQKSKDKDAEEI